MVSEIVVLDSGPLGWLCHPKNPPNAAACRRWAKRLRESGRRIILPEIIDYEIRRDLIRNNAVMAIAALNNLGRQFEYLPLNTAMFRLASEIWAHMRALGRPAAGSQHLDIDVILIAQATSQFPDDFIIATTNVRHFIPLVNAELWENIQ